MCLHNHIISTYIKSIDTHSRETQQHTTRAKRTLRCLEAINSVITWTIIHKVTIVNDLEHCSTLNTAVCCSACQLVPCNCLSWSMHCL